MSSQSSHRAFWKVIFPMVLVLMTVAFGTVGFRLHHLPGQIRPWSQSFFMAAGLPILETTTALTPGATVHWTLQVGRFLGILVPPYAFVLALMVAFHGLYKQLKISSWRFRPWTRRTVVCGLGWKGSELVRDLRAKGYKAAVVDLDEANPFADAVAGANVVFLADDATSAGALRRAGARRAERIYITSGDDELNCRIVNQLVSLLPEMESPARCFVHVADTSLRHYLATWAAKINTLEVTCFNVYESTARGVLRSRPVDRDRIETGKQRIHVALVGAGEMARALLIQLLRIGHFDQDRHLIIDVLSRDVTRYRDRLYAEMPCLRPKWGEPNSPERRIRDWVLPEIAFHELPDSDSELLTDECALYRGICEKCLPSLFICIDNGYRSAAFAGRIMGKLETLCHEHQTSLQVGCYYNYPEDPQKELTRALDNHSADPVTVFDFGSYDAECTVDAIEGRPLDILARNIAAFYENKYGSGPPQDADAEECSKHFARRWRLADEWTRESNRQAADHLFVKLRSIGTDAGKVRSDAFGFSEEQKERMARMEHKRWCAERLLSGWRPLPATEENWQLWNRDSNSFKKQKLHIDLIPFDELPPKEQRKDYDQIEAIPMLLRQAEQSLKVQ